MPRHAGFAAAIAVRQQLLRDLIRVLHHADRLPHRLVGNALVARFDLFLEAPLLTCPASGDRLVLDLTGRGTLTIAPPGDFPSTRTVLFRAHVLAPPKLTLANSTLTFAVDGMAARLESFDIDPLAGGAYPPTAQAVIDSDAFRIALEVLLQTQLDSIGQLTPPLDVGFLGAIAEVPGSTLTSRVMDGAMAIGIDINFEGVTTHGNRALLTDVTAGNDFAMWTNPAALPIVLRDVRTRIEESVAEADASLDSLAFALREGAFHITGSASKENLGSVTFSLDAVPHLIRPGTHEEWDEEYGEHFEITTPDREELWFETTNVVVDVHRPWWSYVLSGLTLVFTLGVGTLVIEAIVAMIRNNITAGIDQGGEGAIAERVQHFTFAGTSEPIFELKIQTYECHVEGVFAGVTLHPQILAPSITGPDILEFEHAANATVRYTVRLPFDAHPEDPMLRVRWVVRRLDTNAIVRTVDREASTNRTIDLTHDPVLLAAAEIQIACNVYSTLGPITTNLFGSTLTLRIVDPFDRSHPFVRWKHQTVKPVVRVEPDGSHTRLGLELVTRTSNIHRTAFPGRCKMARRFSLTRVFGDDPTVGKLEYLDALPFPPHELLARRAVLCDYCFFGGPDKNVPLI